MGFADRLFILGEDASRSICGGRFWVGLALSSR